MLAWSEKHGARSFCSALGVVGGVENVAGSSQHVYVLAWREKHGALCVFCALGVVGGMQNATFTNKTYIGRCLNARLKTHVCLCKA